MGSLDGIQKVVEGHEYAVIQSISILGRIEEPSMMPD
jgi:hypothetical protein